MTYLEDLESDLRAKKDRTEELDELFQLSFLGDAETKNKVSWCVAKMAQNKIEDLRIIDILITMTGSPNAEIRENVAWGIGEAAGYGMCDDRCINAVKELLSDSSETVRGTAVWAAGRIIIRTDQDDGYLKSKLESMENDPSDYVRKAVEFAL